jgi:hypothetical protein
VSECGRLIAFRIGTSQRHEYRQYLTAGLPRSQMPVLTVLYPPQDIRSVAMREFSAPTGCDQPQR